MRLIAPPADAIDQAEERASEARPFDSQRAPRPDRTYTGGEECGGSSRQVA